MNYPSGSCIWTSNSQLLTKGQFRLLLGKYLTKKWPKFSYTLRSLGSRGNLLLHHHPGRKLVDGQLHQRMRMTAIKNLHRRGAQPCPGTPSVVMLSELVVQARLINSSPLQRKKQPSHSGNTRKITLYFIFRLHQVIF